MEGEEASLCLKSESYGHEPRVHLNVHAAASPPGFPLGCTRRAWICGGWGCARRGSPGKTSVIHCFSDEQDEKSFTLAEIKKKLEGEKPCWKSKFKGGLEKIEIEHIEEGLKSRAAKGEVRYDFTFYTPTCRYVRVKVSFFYFIVFVD